VNTQKQLDNMKELVVIEELCEDGQFALMYDYDELPQNVKDKVDEAMTNGGSTTCDIYNDGLQFLLRSNHPKIQVGEEVKIKANVQLYDPNY